MREIWLLPNRRVLWISMLLPATVTFTSMVVIGLSWQQGWDLFRIATVVVGGLGMVAILLLLRAVYTPRLAYEDGHLLVFLRAGQPIRVPIDVVEVFFLGQASAELPDDKREASTVVVRLADRAKEWHEGQVRAALGDWSDGYIIIRGTWCEPLRPELLKQLNKRLVAAHRAQATAKKNSAT